MERGREGGNKGGGGEGERRWKEGGGEKREGGREGGWVGEVEGGRKGGGGEETRDGYTCSLKEEGESPPVSITCIIQCSVTISIIYL